MFREGFRVVRDIKMLTLKMDAKGRERIADFWKGELRSDVDGLREWSVACGIAARLKPLPCHAKRQQVGDAAHGQPL